MHSARRPSSNVSSPKRRPAPKPGQPNEVWLTGMHSVREALRAARRPLFELRLRKGNPKDDFRELAGLAHAAGVPVREVERESLLALVPEGEGNPQGVALRVGLLPELSIAELVKSTASRGPGRRFVALDGVEDPQNLGAIARVAESAGVSGLILTQRRAPGLTPAVARASAGAIDWLPVARVPNLSRGLADLKQAGFWVLAAAPDGHRTLYEMEDRLLTGDLVVVLGAEGKGIRPSVLENSDHRVEIPMRGQVASLNVSTAGAVVLFELFRRAEAAGPYGG